MLKGLRRGGGGEAASGSDSGSSGGSRRESGFGGAVGREGQKLMSKMARALLPNGGKKDRERPHFNPEEHINQKREWSRRYTEQGGPAGAGGGGGPRRDSLFEHFAVVGLPPTINIREVAADIKTFQRLNREAGPIGGLAAAAGGLSVTADTPREEKQRQYGLKGPALQAEVLYTFPGSSHQSSPALPRDLAQTLAAFCFPHGVRPELLERTPSMSALNEVIYSQPYQTHDDQSFVFLMKVADPTSIAPRTLYGVCCLVRELVHRPPSVAREVYAECNAPLSRYLVVAPRCYCLLTHHPFFALHFRVLQTILGLERLERMTTFAAELAGFQLDSQPSSFSLPSPAPSSVQQPASSPGAGTSAGSAPSVNQPQHAQQQQQLAPPVAGAGGAAEEDGSEGSSRRWTDGSGEDGLAAALQQLAVGAEGQGQQQQVQGQQPRPARRGQVSPHCPPQPPEQQPAAAAASDAPPAGQHLAADDATTPEQPIAQGAAVGPTPFFTPAGLSSAIGTPGSRSQAPLIDLQPEQEGAQQQAAGQQAEGRQASPASESDVRRSLDPTLAGVGSSSSSPGLAGGAAAGPAEDAPSPPGGEASSAAAPADARNGWPPASSDLPPQPRSSAGSRRGSRPSSRQQQRSASAAGGGTEDSEGSDAESFLTAGSSAALLSVHDLSPEPSPVLPPLAGGPVGQQGSAAAVHASPSALGSRPASRGADTVPAKGSAAAASQQQRQEAAALPPLLQLEDSAPGAAPAAEGAAPLVQLEGDAAGAVAGEQQAGAQKGEARMPAAAQEPPPLLQLEEGEDGSGAGQEQPAAGQAGLGGLESRLQELQLLESSGGAVDTAAMQQQEQQRHEEQQHEEQQQEQEEQQGDQQHAAGPLPQEPQQGAAGVIGVRVVSFSSAASPAAAAVGSTPPRADVLTCSASMSRGGLQPSPARAGEGEHMQLNGSQAAGQAARGGRHAQQEGVANPQQGQQHQVVRVTATNLDMSRPLRSADLLSVYHASVVPAPGQVFEFQPDPGLQTICFERPDLVEAVKELGLRPTAASLPDIDAAQNLGGWAVAALCRSMSLDNVLTFLAAALLERQIVVFCPNAGLLSGIVLSLIPLLLPFHWQCLLLPVLPAGEGRLELMEAPVPFVLGVLYKTPEVRSKCGGLVRVNVYKDKVKNAGSLPQLPQQAALADALAGSYSELRKIGLTRAASTRPVHMISDAQQVLAECFLSTLQKYLRGLMADLRAYCITDVSASMERTSVLLKDSFVESFPPRDRAFMRHFAETQMFAVYCDAVLQ